MYILSTKKYCPFSVSNIYCMLVMYIYSPVYHYRNRNIYIICLFDVYNEINNSINIDFRVLPNKTKKNTKIIEVKINI